MVLVTEFMLDGKATLMADHASFSKLYGETVSGREVAHTDWSKSSLGKLEVSVRARGVISGVD